MNATIEKFFKDFILPMHKRAEERQDLTLDLALDSSTKSYFTAPVHQEYLYLNNISFDREKLGEHLSELWEGQPELLKMIPDLINLAFQLKDEHEEQSAELSPFVYVMF